MIKRMTGIVIAGFVAVQVLGGGAMPQADIEPVARETSGAEVTAQATELTETARPTAKPSATPAQSTKPTATARPTATPEATAKPQSKATGKPAEASAPAEQPEEPIIAVTPMPVQDAPQIQAPAPPPPAPVPTPQPTPELTPTPEPTPYTARTICNTCGADITDNVPAHGDGHMLNGENFSYRVE